MTVFPQIIQPTMPWQTSKLNSELVAQARKYLLRIERRGELPVENPIEMIRAVVTAPSIHQDAKMKCMQFLAEYWQTDAILKPSDICPDEEDGLTITWQLGGRLLELNFPKSAAGFLYFSTPSDFGVEIPLTAALLRDRLNWVQFNE